MKNFYKKYEDSIIIMINVMRIILGFITKKTIYSIIGVVLLLISVYTFGVEKQNAKKKAERKAELKALRAEQKRLNRGKKKKKKNKKRK